MEVTFDPQDCDEVMEKPTNWSKEKLKALWVSLLNLDAVSKACEDVELQGILLLLETIFSIFKKLKNKHDSTAFSFKMMKHELDVAKEELQQVKEDLKECKNASCQRCLELEKELLIQKKKQENNENRIKSIVNILSMNNGSEDFENNFQTEQHPVVAKAFNLVSQMLLGDEKKFGIKRELQDSTGNDKVRSPGRKKKKLKKVDILGLKETKKEADVLLSGEVLIPETIPTAEEGRNLFTRNKPVPETLDCTERIMLIREDNESTPKKQATRIAEASSPILGGSNKKSCLNGYINSSPQDDSSDECTLTYESVKMASKISLESKSPSLLKSEPCISNVVHETDKSQESNANKNAAKLETKAPSVRNSKENVKKAQADFWKLKSLSHSSGTEAGNRKLKQTTLSLARLPKKNDLSTLKEFNGGVRQSMNESDSLADRINGDCDEETSLQLAIQESLNGNENTEEEVETRNSTVESTEEDDDFIFKSPKARHKKFNPRIRNLFNKKGNTAPPSNSPRKKQSDSLQHKDTDETFFAPLFTSTMKDNCSDREEIKQIPESPDMSSEKLLQELANPAGRSQQVQIHDRSFDRIPEKISTSPNYKYRRNAVRKKEDRQKLDGWECEQCKNYYAVVGDNLTTAEKKQRLKLCSKHRDKYPVCSTTPPGYWDIKLLDTEATRVEDRIK